LCELVEIVNFNDLVIKCCFNMERFLHDMIYGLNNMY